MASDGASLASSSLLAKAVTRSSTLIGVSSSSSGQSTLANGGIWSITRPRHFLCSKHGLPDTITPRI